jgi:PadR family transcriptional regulator, regulatory protein PadR
MFAQQLKGHLDLLLLSVLREGPMHGYALIAALHERSGGAFDLPEGTVYPALHRLEAAGLVRSEWARDTSRRRRVYALTARGERALQAHQVRWQRFRTAMQSVVRDSGPSPTESGAGA